MTKIAAWLAALEFGSGTQRELVVRPHLDEFDRRDGRVEALVASEVIDQFGRRYPNTPRSIHAKGVGDTAAEAIEALERNMT